ncbi:hypothetical protein DBT_0573 [Dissulfuribacter thermophilus]|uniref:Uncharacterized protein n=1 Tax=Dissulfuribacter thermophilus TaxID=1156395 RepID=A0A1B9F8K5_9BACT|nr:hypothetical protein [Dissulfuribacter thermophilus]OCC16111.1 hypothetical protein DBT_0573 [Dissulfuribacter thermophilus]
MKIFPGTSPKTPTIEINNDPKTTNEKGGKAVGRFDEILREKTAVSSPNPASPVDPIQGIQDTSTTTDIQKHALSYGEESLTFLERLSFTIKENPPQKDKILEQYRDILNDRTETLKVIRDLLNEGDPLRDTLNEIGVRTAVEAYKIYRGDYSSG